VRCGFRAGYRLPVYKHVMKAIRRPSELKSTFIYTFCCDFVIFVDTMSSYTSYVRRTCLDANTLWSATFVGSELHSFVLRLAATVIRFFNCIGTRAKVQGTDTLLLQGAKVTWNESSTYGTSTWERKFHNS